MPGLRIRIDLMRIRFRIKGLMTKYVKKLQLKQNLYFYYQKLQFTYL
jgi:hypothetical protein